MQKIKLIATIAALPLFCGTARAEGLVYQLPQDGAWVRYSVEFVEREQEEDDVGKGSLTVSSVGKANENGEACRWIEFNWDVTENGREQKIVAKVLVPEKHLARGTKPIDHVVRAWIKVGDGEPLPLDVNGMRAGPLPSFLAGPSDDAKKLDPEVVETEKLGKLRCEGLSGTNQFKQGSQEITISYLNRLHEKAPFGIVSSRMEFTSRRNSQRLDSGTLSLKLTDLGQDAQSALPESQ